MRFYICSRRLFPARFRRKESHLMKVRICPEKSIAPELTTPFDNYLEENGETIFDDGPPIVAARAPARLDLMGGIADYSGSVVFECPLGRAAMVGCQKRSDDRLKVRSTWLEQLGEPCEVTVPLAGLRGEDPDQVLQNVRQDRKSVV